MAAFEVSTFINRPPQVVFDFMTNPANASKWQGGTESGKLASEGPIGVGSIFHTVGRMMGRKVEMDAEITQWNPPSLWSLKVSNGPLKVEGTNKFEPKDGGTLLVQSFQGEVGGFFKLAEGLAVKQAQKQFETDGQSLKKLLEAM
jgi:uncharacterized protein YndB with AHSA1/START domain